MSTTPTTRRASRPTPGQSALLALAVLARPTIALAVPALVAWLEERPELATPLTGVEHLREGVFLRSKGLSPYESGSYHVSPLYLNIFASAIPLDSPLSVLAWTAADLLAAWAVRAIYLARPSAELQGSSGGANDTREEWGWTTMILYLLNPYTLATCLARSTVTLDNALVLGAIASAAQEQSLMALYLLALATATQLYPVLLLPPILILILRIPVRPSSPSPSSAQAMKAELQRVTPEVARLVGWYTVCLLATLGLEWAYVGDLRFVRATWGTMIALDDLTPNVGMWWYFFTEMFEHFRGFFLGVFQMHVMIYVAPLCIRLRSQPLLVITLMAGIISTFKSYPTLGDAGLWIGLIGCFPELWSDLRYPLLTTCIHLYTLILLPLLHDLWLVAGTGNANFFYAATLVYGLGCGMALVDLLGAGLRWEVRQKVVRRRRAEEEKRGPMGEETPGMGGEKEEKGSGRRETREERDVFLEMGLDVVQYTSL